ncbi:uncharacterized protein M6B38_387080 [Iris pallida]|uniref:Uncharacterized protein n=1 Tax=Iris pallida TaxID=29817 RepID=A0AAX6G2U8_IRIPA|nr:uncharacterized protein M6B38_387080 [Iris pallida]
MKLSPATTPLSNPSTRRRPTSSPSTPSTDPNSPSSSARGDPTPSSPSRSSTVSCSGSSPGGNGGPACWTSWRCSTGQRWSPPPEGPSPRSRT